MGYGCSTYSLAGEDDRQVDVELSESFETIQGDSRVCSESIVEEGAVQLVILLSDESSGNRRLDSFPKTR